MANFSRALALAVCSATLAITLTACATASPAASPPASTPTETSAVETPTATPTPSDTPTPVQDPADPSTWLITESAIGPLELGANLQDTTASVSALFVADFQCGQGRFFDGVAGATGLGLVLGSAETGDAASVEELSISTPHGSTAAEVPTPRTAEGIGLGSPEADALAAYPSGTRTDPDPATGWDFVLYEVTTAAGTLAFTWTPSDRIVRSIRLTAEGYDPGSCM